MLMMEIWLFHFIAEETGLEISRCRLMVQDVNFKVGNDVCILCPTSPAPSHGGKCPRLFAALWVDSGAPPSLSSCSLPRWLSPAAFILVRHAGICWAPQYFTWTSAHSHVFGNQYYFLQIKPAFAPTFHPPIPLLITLSGRQGAQAICRKIWGIYHPALIFFNLRCG